MRFIWILTNKKKLFSSINIILGIMAWKKGLLRKDYESVYYTELFLFLFNN